MVYISLHTLNMLGHREKDTPRHTLLYIKKFKKYVSTSHLLSISEVTC